MTTKIRTASVESVPYESDSISEDFNESDDDDDESIISKKNVDETEEDDEDEEEVEELDEIEDLNVSDCDEVECEEIDNDSDNENTLLDDRYEESKTTQKIDLIGSRTRRQIPKQFGVKNINWDNNYPDIKLFDQSEDYRQKISELLKNRKLEVYVYNAAISCYKKKYNTTLKKSELHKKTFQSIYLDIAYSTLQKISCCNTPEEHKKLIENIKKYDESKSEVAILDSIETNEIETPLKVVEGIFVCHKCKAKKTLFYQKQIKSCDEPQTTFCCCTQCNNRWSF